MCMNKQQAHQQSQSTGGRVQAVLLTAVALLLAADVFVRLEPTAARAQPTRMQPEGLDTDVPTLVNPARQRSAMIEELVKLNSRIGALESKLDNKIRVEVTNFPKVEAAARE
jgi:hypothetical protein